MLPLGLLLEGLLDLLDRPLQGLVLGLEMPNRVRLQVRNGWRVRLTLGLRLPLLDGHQPLQHLPRRLGLFPGLALAGSGLVQCLVRDEPLPLVLLLRLLLALWRRCLCLRGRVLRRRSALDLRAKLGVGRGSDGAAHVLGFAQADLSEAVDDAPRCRGPGGCRGYWIGIAPVTLF